MEDRFPSRVTQIAAAGRPRPRHKYAAVLPSIVAVRHVCASTFWAIWISSVPAVPVALVAADRDRENESESATKRGRRESGCDCCTHNTTTEHKNGNDEMVTESGKKVLHPGLCVCACALTFVSLLRCCFPPVHPHHPVAAAAVVGCPRGNHAAQARQHTRQTEGEMTVERGSDCAGRICCTSLVYD